MTVMQQASLTHPTVYSQRSNRLFCLEKSAILHNGAPSPILPISPQHIQGHMIESGTFWKKILVFCVCFFCKWPLWNAIVIKWNGGRLFLLFSYCCQIWVKSDDKNCAILGCCPVWDVVFSMRQNALKLIKNVCSRTFRVPQVYWFTKIDCSLEKIATSAKCKWTESQKDFASIPNDPVKWH